MKRYKITVEQLNADADAVPASGNCLTLEAENHDNLSHIVEAVRLKKLFDSDKSAALAIGLKLLFELVLKNRRGSLLALLCDPSTSN